MSIREKIYLMLGRYGDIMNILPAVYQASTENHILPSIVTSKAYSSLIRGVDYCRSIVFNDDFRLIHPARRLIENQYPNADIKICAVYGKDYRIDRKCWNYQREAWRLSETKAIWGKEALVINNRSKTREKELVERLDLPKDKKIILTSLKGVSSPIEKPEELLNYLKQNINKDEYHILDISDVKAEMIYDLLCLYEKAHSLITIDTATLHLANAVPNLPVVSLITDSKDDWHKSFWRPNHIARIYYSEIDSNKEKILLAAIQGWQFQRPRIRLITSYNLSNNETARRIKFAQETWKQENRLSKCMWDIYNYEISSIPRVKNMIESIAEKSKEDDILVICNADISFVPMITGEIIDKIKKGSIYLHRHDFYYKLDRHFISEHQVAEGKWYPGSDCFIFTKKWWEENKVLMPDMYFGREAWDMVMRNIIKRSGGAEIHNGLYHEKHKSYWEKNRNCPENLHNRSLAKNWLDTYGGNWNDWKLKHLIYKY